MAYDHERLLVCEEEECLMYDETLDLSRLLDMIKEFTDNAKDADGFEVSINGVFTIQKVRSETDEEYDARMKREEEYKIKEKRRRDKSWERQKKRFQRARNKHIKN